MVSPTCRVSSSLGAWLCFRLPYRTTLLRGTLNVGLSGIRLVGVLWLISALGFGAAALLLFRGSAAWFTLTLAAAVFSLVLCLAGLPETRIGLMVDVLVLVGLALAVKTGGLGNR